MIIGQKDSAIPDSETASIQLSFSPCLFVHSFIDLFIYLFRRQGLMWLRLTLSHHAAEDGFKL